MKTVMLRRLSPVTLLAAVRSAVEAGTGKACVSDPDGRKAPFYGMELVGSEPKRTKCMRLDEFSVYIHAFAPPSPSLAGQDEDGIVQIKRDESDEWHAVIAYRFIVSYGLLVK